MKLFEISNYLDTRVPLAFQEEYDNCGLLVGNKNSDINSILVALDCTEEVLNEAIDHINKYGTMHTDAIITKNKLSAKYFIKNIKSSIAMHNTSTQFADGGEFGFGGEVGISTNTLPPRGPVGLNQLVSYKYQISINGKIRK